MNSTAALPGWTQGFLARLLAGFLIIAIPIAILLSGVLTAQASQSLVASTERSTGNLALGASLRLDTWLGARQSDIEWVARLMQGHLNSDGSALLQDSQSNLANEFDAVEVVDSSGKRLFGIGSIDFQPGLQTWFQQSLNQPMITPISLEGNAIQWSVTAPIPATGAQPAAAVVGDLRLNRLSDVLGGFDAGGSTELHVVNADRHVIYSSDWGQISGDTALIAKGSLRLSESTPALDRALAGDSGAVRTTDYRGEDVLAGYAPVPLVGWGLIASVLASVALAPVNNQLVTSIIVAALAIGLAVLVAAFIARSFARPVVELSNASGRVVGGDLTTRVAPSGSRELRHLGERFNSMIQQLEHLVVGLRELSSRASQSATRLSSASEELAAATTEQTAAATETSASMEELARTTTSIAETLQRVSVQAQETRENLEQAQSDMQASGSRTLALAERVNDVNEILGIINEIADQTNLLALNAAIEAARAGESGRGFAVVADEVRRLAERSKSSAGRISKIIESARSESNATVMAMEQSTKQMQRGLKLLEDVVDASSQVQVITQQQRSATEQVLESMEQIAAGSRQVAKTAQEISSAAAGHAGLAGEMATMSRNGTNH